MELLAEVAFANGLLARFVCICARECAQIFVLPPSSRRQADVHRTSAFDYSNLAFIHIKNPIHLDGVFDMELLARFELATSSLPRSWGAAPP